MTNAPRVNFGGKASDYYVSNAWPPIPRYYNREVFIGGESAGPTNIVISNGYSGTIQIGTNFWKVGEIGVKASDTEAVIQSLEAFTARLNAAHAERNRHIRNMLYIHALAGYCAATNGVPFERISNHVEEICAKFFPAPRSATTSETETHGEPDSSSSSKP